MPIICKDFSMVELKAQNQVLTVLSKAENLAKLPETAKIARNFTHFAELVCSDHDFSSPNGCPQISTCCNALRTLEDRNLIKLPKSWHTRERNWTPATLDSPIELPIPPEKLSTLEDAITIVRVETKEDMLCYNTILKYEYNNLNQLPPRPVRYLVKTPDGVIGALGFSSPAINNAQREAFIGWNRGEKDCYLHYVADLRVFVVREGYGDLGSIIIEKTIKELRSDYKKLYGIDLVAVERIVPLSEVKNFSKHGWSLASSKKPLKIANKEISEKNIDKNKNTNSLYIYTYYEDYKERLAPHITQVENNIEQYLNESDWVVKELNKSNYDKRLLHNTQNIVQAKFNSPTQSFLKCCNGSKSAQKSLYRTMETENSNYNFQNILEPFFFNTGVRASAYPIILWPSDGSDLNYEHLPHCTGLGMIGTSNQVPGLHLHTTLGVTPDKLVLGVGYATCGDTIHRKNNDTYSYNIPLENKNSYVWYLHAAKIHELMKNYRVINVFLGDRGADDFGLYEYILSLNNMEFVIRSEYNRKLEGETQKLHDVIKKVPSMGRVELEIEYKRKNGSNKSHRGENKKNKKGKNKGNTATTEEPKKSKFGKRKAVFDVSYKEVTILPPDYRKNSSPIKLTVVRGLEVPMIPGRKKEEWILLTSLKIKSVEDAIKCIKYYRNRWTVEEYFRVLKSGCNVEKVFYDKCERVLRSIAINLIVAWRVLFIGLLGGKLPNVPADVMFDSDELKVLFGYSKLFNCTPPNTLSDALFIVGMLGGASVNRQYPYPGYMSIKDGLTKIYNYKYCLNLSRIADQYSEAV